MPLISFAQNQEDVMLWRALRDVRDGFYIDVGAADPHEMSVTRLFSEQGWSGINAEPDPTYFRALSEARPRDVNIEAGIGAEPGRQVFYDIEGTGLSTFDAEIAARHKADGRTAVERQVDVTTLAELCRAHRPHGPIHFLKVDVEGAEADVLAGADFQAFRPWIVLVEATKPLSQEQNHETWEPILTGQGYGFAWFDGLNRFYLSDERRPALERHFRVQPNVFDDFIPAASALRRAQEAERAAAAAVAVQESLAAEMQQRVAIEERIGGAAIRAIEAVKRAALEQERQSSLAAQARREADDLSARLAAAETRAAGLSAELDRTRAALDEVRLLQQSDAEAVRRAEEQVARMFDSTSWRLSMPLRVARRALAGSPVPIPPRLVGLPKHVARRVYHFGVRGLLRLPGAAPATRTAYALAPSAVEWLAVRYRFYESGIPPAPRAAADAGGARAADQKQGRAGEGADQAAGGSARPCSLSAAESRIRRQLADA